jgi:hypothetical protein
MQIKTPAMQPDPETPAPNDTPNTPGVPTPLNPTTPPVIGSPSVADLAAATPTHAALEPLLTGLLSLCLAFFLADGLVSLVDDTCVLLLDLHALLAVRVVVFILAALLALVVYALIGLTPMVPKRLFLPLALFYLFAQLATIPFYIYDYYHVQWANWGMSLLQVALALGLLAWAQGGFKPRWPLLPPSRLGPRGFSWLNLSLFVGLNLFVLLPSTLASLWVCAGLAVDHFSDSFMALRPGGFTVQVRTYGRDDGKRIKLVPMAHIGEPEFYRALAQSFPTNALILMEGVTDSRDLLTNKISYHRAAAALGLAEQQREFKPRRERLVRADVDVDVFAPSTIDLLNAGMLIHTRGLNAQTLSQLAQYSPPPHFEQRLVEDLLRKRNRRLLDEIKKQLPHADLLIVPWGVAHMPEIARAIQQDGFRLQESREYVAIRFGARDKTTASPVGAQGNSQ